MLQIEHARLLAAAGFYVFPLKAGTKDKPLIKDFPNKASRNPADINEWWGKWPDANVAISTTHFGDDQALLVVDVDNKGGKSGDAELVRLEFVGKDFPATMEQRTPTGGRHLVYLVQQAVKQGVDVFARGLDVRSRGGYIVGAGSVTERGAYTATICYPAPAPEWMVTACGTIVGAKTADAVAVVGVDVARAIKRAADYLDNHAPLAVEGEGGDTTTFKVVTRVKDFGVPQEAALDLLLDHWNDRCSPPWDVADLERKMANAYRYGQNEQGSVSPEADFGPVAPPSEPAQAILSPIGRINAEYALVLAGGGHHVLWETTDEKGKFKLDHLGEASFHKALASRVMQLGDKTKPVTDVWMSHPDRRFYKGMCFMPGLPTPAGWYNLWRGFDYEPYATADEAAPAEKRAVAMFFDHALKNVCNGDEALNKWLIGYFAHMVQRPWEKPLTSLVFRGSKGVGKNALVERIGDLFGTHALVTPDGRYLTSHFNGHFERLVLVCFDEAFWSGDRQMEGKLKGLITGKHHIIEHKGKEPYSVDNRLRVIIIGNEEWLVPASHDERRFAVFSVGEGRKQDHAFFERMRVDLERGGYRLLLRALLDFDITGININDAPKTRALRDQKEASLDTLETWWLDCLIAGEIIGSDFGGAWPDKVLASRFRAAYARNCRERNIRGRIEADNALGRKIKNILKLNNKKMREGSELFNGYLMPTLAEARDNWDKHVGHPRDWTE